MGQHRRCRLRRAVNAATWFWYQVETAFTVAGTGSKKRPAVVLSTEVFNASGTKLITAAITGNLTPPLRPGDTILTDWIMGGLLKHSAVRGVLATVDKGDVIRTLGKLSPHDMTTVSSSLASILGFEERATQP